MDNSPKTRVVISMTIDAPMQLLPGIHGLLMRLGCQVEVEGGIVREARETYDEGIRTTKVYTTIEWLKEVADKCGH